jgi:hypothetical protein
MALGKLEQDVLRLTHCPHIDGLRMPTGRLSECLLSTTMANNIVDSYVEKLTPSSIHRLWAD